MVESSPLFQQCTHCLQQSKGCHFHVLSPPSPHIAVHMILICQSYSIQYDICRSSIHMLMRREWLYVCSMQPGVCRHPSFVTPLKGG